MFWHQPVLEMCGWVISFHFFIEMLFHCKMERNISRHCLLVQAADSVLFIEKLWLQNKNNNCVISAITQFQSFFYFSVMIVFSEYFCFIMNPLEDAFYFIFTLENVTPSQLAHDQHRGGLLKIFFSIISCSLSSILSLGLLHHQSFTTTIRVFLFCLFSSSNRFQNVYTGSHPHHKCKDL